MDFIPGGNLFHFVQIRPLTLAEAAVCSAEIVLALAFLHERRIVYRDLKLENIMVDVDGHILLTDFGLARKVRNNVKLNDEAGTRAYFAPGEPIKFLLNSLIVVSNNFADFIRNRNADCGQKSQL